MCNSLFVSKVGRCGSVWMLNIGGLGCVYYVIGLLYLSASIKSWVGLYENVSCMFSKLGGYGLWCIWSYSFYGLYLGGRFCHCIYYKIVNMGTGCLCFIFLGWLNLLYSLVSLRSSLALVVVIDVHCMFQGKGWLSRPLHRPRF